MTLETNEALHTRIVEFQKEMSAQGFGTVVIAAAQDIEARDKDTDAELKVASCYLEKNSINLESMILGGLNYIAGSMSSPVVENSTPDISQ